MQLAVVSTDNGATPGLYRSVDGHDPADGFARPGFQFRRTADQGRWRRHLRTIRRQHRQQRHHFAVRSLNGNLQNSEMQSMDYDRLAKAFIGGAQDTGFQEQIGIGVAPWNKTSNGDGGDAAVDVTSLPGRSIRYGSSQNLSGCFRATYTNDVQRSRAFPALTPLSAAPAMSGQFGNHNRLR